MAVLVGIDEAGFGPILGPLVVSSSTFSVPRNLIGADLWQTLRKSLANKRKRLAGRLLITDSKKAYSKSLGTKHLERTVIACLKCLGKGPATLNELISLLCPDCLERLSDYPWYKGAGGCPIAADFGELSRAEPADIALASAVLADDLTANGIKLLKLQSCCLDVAHYNKMVGSVKNKSRVLFTETSRLIKNAFDNFAEDKLQIIVDRQGGRIHYRSILQRMFSDMELKILSESPAASSYELQADDKKMRLHFVVGADERFLPVSLASMVSKYLRELLVANINRYFAGHFAELKPTAGYWKDGLRFIEDLKENIPHIRYDHEQLVRCR
jgi:ribonuclease HII